MTRKSFCAGNSLIDLNVIFTILPARFYKFNRALQCPFRTLTVYQLGRNLTRFNKNLPSTLDILLSTLDMFTLDWGRWTIFIYLEHQITLDSRHFTLVPRPSTITQTPLLTVVLTLRTTNCAPRHFEFSSISNVLVEMLLNSQFWNWRCFSGDPSCEFKISVQRVSDKG